VTKLREGDEDDIVVGASFKLSTAKQLLYNAIKECWNKSFDNEDMDEEVNQDDFTIDEDMNYLEYIWRIEVLDIS
jgi:hypothetical protein